MCFSSNRSRTILMPPCANLFQWWDWHRPNIITDAVNLFNSPNDSQSSFHSKHQSPRHGPRYGFEAHYWVPQSMKIAAGDTDHKGSLGGHWALPSPKRSLFFSWKKKPLQTPRESDLEEFPKSKLRDIQIKGDNWDIPKSLGVSKLSTIQPLEVAIAATLGVSWRTGSGCFPKGSFRLA